MTDSTPLPDRRTALAAGAGLFAAGLPATDPPAKPATAHDFTTKSAALEPDRVVKSACQFCNSLSGLNVHLKAGRVIDIRGEANAPVQAGELCVKGPMMAQLVYNRPRIKTPLRRTGKKGDPASKF